MGRKFFFLRRQSFILCIPQNCVYQIVAIGTVQQRVLFCPHLAQKMLRISVCVYIYAISLFVSNISIFKHLVSSLV